jgi:hypothetical protein
MADVATLVYERTVRPGIMMGAVVTSSAQVLLVLCAITIGWGQAINRRIQLFGWQNREWSEAWLEFFRVAKESLPAPEQADGGTTSAS